MSIVLGEMVNQKSVMRERGFILINRMDIENCAEDAKNLSVLAGTIHDALCYSPSTPDAHFASVALLENLLQNHAEKLNAIVVSIFCQENNTVNPVRK